MSRGEGKKHVGMLLFEGFELLDVFGPAEVFGVLGDRVQLHMIGATEGTVASAQGPRVATDLGLDGARDLDLVLVPGGIGTRREVDNATLISWLAAVAADVEYLVSVCTGAALLARAGVLDNRKATTNKMAFEWVTTQGPRVDWVKQARWVVDGKFWTSSGVTAGIDMAFALVEEVFGADIAARVADGIEYERHVDSDWDPFAQLHEFTRS